MGTMKKIGALIMALAMCFALAMPAFAAGGNTQSGTGTITVDNAKQVVIVEKEDGSKETKTDNSYTAYQVFAASPSNDGNDQSAPSAATGGTVGYTATEAQKTYWADKGLFEFAGNSGKYIVTLKDGVTSKEVAEYFNALTDAQIAQMVTDGVLAAGVNLSFNDTKDKASAEVAYGYYFIASSNGSVVSIDTTNNNVVIEDKNEYGTDPFDPGHGDNEDGQLKNTYKVNGVETGYTVENGVTTANAASVSIGDVVTYRISSATSNYVEKTDSDGKTNTEKVTFVYIDDKIDEGLTYYSDDTYTTTVTVRDELETYTLTAGARTAEQNAAKPTYYYKEVGNAFTVIIPWCDAEGNPVFRSGAVVTMTYNAQVNAKIAVSDGTNPSKNADNKAILTYNSVPGTQDVPTNPDDPTPGKDEGNGTNTGVNTSTSNVYTYALAFQKLDGNTGAALAGAHFNVKSTADGAANLFGKAVEGKPGYYMIDVTKTSAGEGYTDDFETDSNGQIILHGVNGGDYKATEINAPAGYNLLNDPVTLTAVESGKATLTQTITTTDKYHFVEDEAGTYKKNDDGTFSPIAAGDTAGKKYKIADSSTTTGVEEGSETFTFDVAARSVSVPNFSGTELPSTGGIGTTIFYVVGGVMVIGAGVLLITKKRMAE